MSQKQTLITNIVLSEIQYNQKILQLSDPWIYDDARETICNSLDNDHVIISKWCTDFGITKEDIMLQRPDILSDVFTNIDDDAQRRIDEYMVELDRAIEKNDIPWAESAGNSIEKIRRDTIEKKTIISDLQNKDLLWQL